jgi:hypothetical protein
MSNRWIPFLGAKSEEDLRTSKALSTGEFGVCNIRISPGFWRLSDIVMYMLLHDNRYHCFPFFFFFLDFEDTSTVGGACPGIGVSVPEAGGASTAGVSGSLLSSVKITNFCWREYASKNSYYLLPAREHSLAVSPACLTLQLIFLPPQSWRF